jgi:nicotinate-nucleotide pyrophosphorylase (carboxylating)
MIEPPQTSIIREAVNRALGEDRGPADITTMALISADRTASGRIFVKEPCVLAGLPVAERVFLELDVALSVKRKASDGDRLEAGATVLELQGPAHAILSGERVALNFLQHLSGIATETRRFVDAAAGGAVILDTRKTLPGVRALQKYAVRCGGGTNHRMGLYDAFMIKDNHVALSGGTDGLAGAVKKARAFDPDVELVAEADTLDQVRELAGLGVDRILLDNMSSAQMKEAVAIVAGRCALEASGNMTLARIPEVAATGVGFISVGSLTHSVGAVDISLEIFP